MSENRSAKKNNKIVRFFLIGLSIILMFLQSYGLYKRQYELYSYTRIWIAPLLFLSIFKFSMFNKFKSFVYIGLILAAMADIFVIFGANANSDLSILGLSFYTYTYLAIAFSVQQISEKENENAYLYFFAVIIIDLGLNFVLLKIPPYKDVAYYGLIGVHSLVLLFGLYQTILMFPLLKKQKNYFIPISILMMVGFNVLYAIDILHFRRSHGSVDGFIALGFVLYLIAYTQGSWRLMKRF